MISSSSRDSRSGNLNGWVRGGDYQDILDDTLDVPGEEGSGTGPGAGRVARVTINRPEVRNAFRPATLFELSHAFDAARDDPQVGVIILTGAGTEAFCSGGHQRVRGDDGYQDAGGVGR